MTTLNNGRPSMTLSGDPRLVAATSSLAASLPGYEERPQQAVFSEAVLNAIESGRHLIAEAGTGTGKSLGYLIPAIVSKRRTIVSTGTKALQDQIMGKDLPFLAEHLGVPFTYAVLKGRSNYLCVNTMLTTDPAEIPSTGALGEFIKGEWPEGFTGERYEVEAITGQLPHREWAKIAADSDACSAAHCSKNPIELCFAEAARQRAANADIVVVNHALYCMDALVLQMTGGNASLIGPHGLVILDEAHEFGDVATNSFGFTVREAGLRNLAGEVRNFAHQVEANLDAQIGAFLLSVDAMWRGLEVGTITPDMVAEGTPYAEGLVALSQSLDSLNESLLAIRGSGQQEAKDRVRNKVVSAKGRVLNLLLDSFAQTVRWVEIDGYGREQKKVLRAAPIDVSEILRHSVWEHVTAVLASATLSVNGSMSYVASELGIDSYDSIDVGTPFDYPNQGVLYIPSDLPDPGRERDMWSSMAITRMLELVKAAGGRSLLLFTSYKEMQAAYSIISQQVPFNCMMQGQRENKVLADDFKADETSVLFATRSFMVGIDVPGDALKLVVINKLMFAVPTDPLVEARCNAIEARGGKSFFDYTIPSMTLTLKQAVGRLIRTKTDTGVVAVLDPRLHSKSYGRGIIASLPPMPVVKTMGEIEQAGVL